jgi:tRNA 2-thiouridine synthesizing protein A
MKVKHVDARGLSCPQPVILTQKAIEGGSDSLEIIVSSEVSKENVLRILNKYNMKTELRGEGDDIIIRASK